MTSVSTPRKRRLSIVSPEEGRRVLINEPNSKKVKSDSTAGSGGSTSITSGTTPAASNISNNNDVSIMSTAPKTLHHKNASNSSNIDNIQTNSTTNNSNTNLSSGTAGELQTLSQTLTPDFTFDPALRKKFLDPAINALFRTMKKELEEKEKMIEDLRNELDGIGFTPNSITGKKLVAKLRALQHENEELGRQLRQGRVEQYEVEIAMQRKVIDELKAGLEESDSQLLLMDEENERLQDISPDGDAEEKSGGNKSMSNDDVDMDDNENRELQSNNEENTEKVK
ncbi:13107_t:CDS:2 [Ambispora gerdemannii]|uniref:13107_t:CDS:1 n=1 Tax=Ambispora gerdemannii TaxID=144530 RepID=A0A9N9FJ75_9GLOM|nr:13107_t:CDS:2 [Ambispora gerdemannii]